MPRTLDTVTLDAAAKHYAMEFLREEGVPHARAEGKFVLGRPYVMQDFFNFDYKDEFEYMLSKMRGQLGSDALVEFDALAEERFTPRSDETLAKLLAEKLAVDVDGNHVSGRIGTVKVDGYRYMGQHIITVETPDSALRRRLRAQRGEDRGPRETHRVAAPEYWPIYAGETEERVANSGVADDLPDGTPGQSVGALATRTSLNFAIAMVDAGLLLLDEGTVGAVLEGRTTPRPANVTDAVTGTLLFALNSDDATTFAGAVDAGPGAIATAGVIDDDVSANATGTLLYVRASSANSVDTPLNDHLEGEAGTSGADFNFNTLAIVSGATVSLTSWTVTQPEG